MRVFIIFGALFFTQDWKEDYYGNRARTPTQRGTSQAQGDESMYHQEGQTSSNPTSNEEDSGLPYMGEN